ncbi:MAG: energy-coupled thiamine transporter ThiT [Candidatus Latescibacterota bacterium]|nr:energy-coupled thiamine transporter ThiT [Candidatus Latescibacterota bacterium]
MDSVASEPPRIRMIAELAIGIALAAVLSLLRIKLPHLIYGGSVSLHAVPLVILALRHGAKAGIGAGAVYGVVNFVVTPYFVHPLQLVLDYPLAFGALGIAGWLRPWHQVRRRRVAVIVASVLLAHVVRFGFHFASGVVYFGELAPEGVPVMVYSGLYNASYLVPEAVLTAVITVFVMRRIEQT